MTAVLALALIVYMAVAYRYRGGWNFGLGDQPRWLELFAVSWPMGLAGGLAAIDSGATLATAGGLGVGVLGLTFAAHSLGHGNAMNLGRREYTGDERVEVWDRIVGRLRVGAERAARWRRDAMALGLSGMVVLWPLAAALAFGGRFAAAALLAVLGAGKVLAYEIGWTLHVDGSRWRQATEIGEAMFGALLGLAVALALA